MHTQALARQVQRNTTSIRELQNLMADLIRAQTRTEEGLQQLQQEMREFKEEMRAFKDEMLDFKDEMRAFKDEMLEFKDEMRAFKDEMLDFKNEMRDFKDEMRAFKDEMLDFKDEMRDFKEETRKAQQRADQERREMNRRWGELANKMGTLAEDLVAPNIPRIFRDLLGCPPERILFSGVRVRKRHAFQHDRVKEFDVVVICDDYVLINETKSSLNSRDVDDFVATLEEIRDFFPEHQEKKFIGAIATLYMPPEVAKYAERNGILALGFGEENMDVLNSPNFTPKLF